MEVSCHIQKEYYGQFENLSVLYYNEFGGKLENQSRELSYAELEALGN